MFRKFDYENCGGYNPKYKTCQDLDLWFKLSNLSDIAIIEKELVRRYINDNSISASSKVFNQIKNACSIRLKNIAHKKNKIVLFFIVIYSSLYHLLMTFFAIIFRNILRISAIFKK